MRIGNGVLRVSAEAGIPYEPRFVVAGPLVTAGPYTDSAEHERHLLETVGAGNWQDSGRDEFRFTVSGRELASVWLQVPEDAAEIGRDCRGWAAVSRENVGIALDEESGPSGFLAPPCVSSLVTPSGEAVLCVTADFAAACATSRRLAVCDGLDLLFLADSYVGWMLTGPELYVSPGWQNDPRRAPADSELGEVIKGWLLVAGEALVEALEEGSGEARQVIEDLKGRIRVDEGAEWRRSVVRTFLCDLLAWHG